MPANVLPASSLFVFVCDYYNPLDLQFDDVRFTIKVTTLYFILIPNTLHFINQNELQSYIVNHQIVKLFIPESNQPQSYHVYLKGIYP
jgi:hypothetical protein